MLPAANVRGPHHVRSMEWRLRRVVPAAAVTTHAKPHVQQQLARDLEVERAAMGQRCRPQSAARQSAATSIAGFLVNCSSAAVPPMSSAGRVRFHTCCECYNKRGYIHTWYVYQNFLFHFPFDEIYRRLLFFTLGGSVSA